jgi:predicted ester cyclase
MTDSQMFALAKALAVAKSRQDVPAALEVLHPEMVLQTPAFESVARGHAENRRALTRFFATFPDYDVQLDGHAGDGETLVCWGTVRMTMTGNRFGVEPNGNRAELPVHIRFTFADDLIASERFFFDLASLCAQSGVSTDVVQRTLLAAVSR